MTPDDAGNLARVCRDDPPEALEAATLREAALAFPLAPAQQRELAGKFMAMGQSHDPERRRLLWAYKHVETRRYLFLDEAGGAYTYDAGGGRYTPLPVRDAVAHARAAA